jgi:hypothetical protein
MSARDTESLESLAGDVVASWEAFTSESRPVPAASLLLEHQEAVTLLRIGLAQAQTDRNAGD